MLTFKVKDGDKDLDWRLKKCVYTNFRVLNVPEDWVWLKLIFDQWVL